MKLLIVLFTFVLMFCDCNLQKFLATDDEAITTIQLIRKYGYPAEKHTVETEDGYLLGMHRIPHGTANITDSSAFDRKKIPVLLQHGLLGSSMDFVLLGPKSALAFLLADLGFDVWLGNFRGNTYSRAHKSLSPKDSKFWDFSWHESGIYDLPAEINYITSATEMEKVIYIGHSMGTTGFFVMTSSLPEYNDRIELALLMAPVAYVKNIKSPLVRVLTPFLKPFRILDDLIGYGEFLRHTPLLYFLSNIFCTLNDIEKRLCESVLFMVTGADPEELNTDMLPLFLQDYPAGYSIKGIFHYTQLLESGKFREYDYGKFRNMERYGSEIPPDYNVSSITAEMNFYYSLNDYLATPPDVKHLAKELRTLKKMRLVSDPKFSHVDFVLAMDVKELLYDGLIKDLQAHLNKNNQM